MLFFLFYRDALGLIQLKSTALCSLWSFCLTSSIFGKKGCMPRSVWALCCVTLGVSLELRHARCELCAASRSVWALCCITLGVSFVLRHARCELCAASRSVWALCCVTLGVSFVLHYARRELCAASRSVWALCCITLSVSFVLHHARCELYAAFIHLTASIKPNFCNALHGRKWRSNFEKLQLNRGLVKLCLVIVKTQIYTLND